MTKSETYHIYIVHNMSKETNKPPKWIKDAVAEVQEQGRFWLRLLDEGREEECEFQMEVFINYINSEEYLK